MSSDTLITQDGNPFVHIVSRMRNLIYLPYSHILPGGYAVVAVLVILNICTGAGVLVAQSFNGKTLELRRLWIFRWLPHSTNSHCFVQPNVVVILGLNAILTSLFLLPHLIMGILSSFPAHAGLRWTFGFLFHTGSLLGLPQAVCLWFACFGCMYIFGAPERFVHPFFLNGILFGCPIAFSILTVCFSVVQGLVGSRLGVKLFRKLAIATRLKDQYDQMGPLAVNTTSVEMLSESSLDSHEAFKQWDHASHSLWGCWAVYQASIFVFYIVIFSTLLRALRLRLRDLRSSAKFTIPPTCNHLHLNEDTASGTPPVKDSTIIPATPSLPYRTRTRPDFAHASSQKQVSGSVLEAKERSIHSMLLIRLQVICFTISIEFALTVVSCATSIISTSWLLFGRGDLRHHPEHRHIIDVLAFATNIVASNICNISMILRTRYVRRQLDSDIELLYGRDPVQTCGTHRPCFGSS